MSEVELVPRDVHRRARGGDLGHGLVQIPIPAHLHPGEILPGVGDLGPGTVHGIEDHVAVLSAVHRLDDVEEVPVLELNGHDSGVNQAQDTEALDGAYGPRDDDAFAGTASAADDVRQSADGGGGDWLSVRVQDLTALHYEHVSTYAPREVYSELRLLSWGKFVVYPHLRYTR